MQNFPTVEIALANVHCQTDGKASGSAGYSLLTLWVRVHGTITLPTSCLYNKAKTVFGSFTPCARPGNPARTITAPNRGKGSSALSHQLIHDIAKKLRQAYCNVAIADSSSDFESLMRRLDAAGQGTLNSE